ncbi:26S proteasome non-ATPase regulatory subunit 4-like isoform X1 [Cyanistes caeruleus]|uniref:26S proteasome non-ATPase regulatory subunit 4-like isoform X1 n=1 Tax=Cyanistes caeruleus TaxID=156563 RepID=UPI000CDB8326|nr:26S proteasome non-ATPase regulatory subunit 4-like isoform X1 [Cyanistes caeruleus]
MRIIAFVGSPVLDSDKDLVKLAKRLKKEKVNVDIINFGEEEANTEKLTAFITALNGKDGSGSHLVTVPPGPSLADALISSPVLAGEGGAVLGLGASDFEFGVDPSADPELALGLGISVGNWTLRKSQIWFLHHPSFPRIGNFSWEFQLGIGLGGNPRFGSSVTNPSFPRDWEFQLGIGLRNWRKSQIWFLHH